MFLYIEQQWDHIRSGDFEKYVVRHYQIPYMKNKAKAKFTSVSEARACQTRSSVYLNN